MREGCGVWLMKPQGCWRPGAFDALEEKVLMSLEETERLSARSRQSLAMRHTRLRLRLHLPRVYRAQSCVAEDLQAQVDYWKGRVPRRDPQSGRTRTSGAIRRRGGARRPDLRVAPDPVMRALAGSRGRTQRIPLARLPFTDADLGESRIESSPDPTPPECGREARSLTPPTQTT